MSEQTEIQVIHNAEASRFEVQLDGDIAVADYRVDVETVTFYRTVVPPAFGGRGIASKLVRGALDWSREQGYVVVPECSFVAGYIDKHPEYQDLTAK